MRFGTGRGQPSRMPAGHSTMPANSAPASTDARAIRSYFETVYPSRHSIASGSLFRLGEKERIAVLREWMSDCDCTEVLDIGCGDGVLLEAVLPPDTRRVRVEDIVPARVREAARRIDRPDRIVEAAVADINLPAAEAATFDVVLAIGVLDYNPDWEAIIERIWRRTRGTLIVDFPRAAGFRSLIRKLWLRMHDVECRFTGLAQLEALLEPYAQRSLVTSLSHNWLARISVTPRRSGV